MRDRGAERAEAQAVTRASARRGGLFCAVLYDPVWTTYVNTPCLRDRLLGFVLLRLGRAVVSLSARSTGSRLLALCHVSAFRTGAVHDVWGGGCFRCYAGLCLYTSAQAAEAFIAFSIGRYRPPAICPTKRLPAENC